MSEEGGLHSQEAGNAAGVPLYVPQEGSQEVITRKYGLDCLHDAGLNKARRCRSKHTFSHAVCGLYARHRCRTMPDLMSGVGLH